MTCSIKFSNVTKEYLVGENTFRALNDISFEINEGEFVVILGPSGAGKTTLLNLLGGMDTPTSGEIVVGEENITNYNNKKLTEYRASRIGFVFQFYNLIAMLTARENVALVREIRKEAHDAGEVLRAVGLTGHEDQFVSQLSGGEQQRVAIARAIAKKPSIMLCDEPTGALDTETGKIVMGLLQDISTKEFKTVIIVTHNASFAEIADRVIHIKNGRISDVVLQKSPKRIEEVEL
jgi:putative ABC transport system ATP-binding protein